MKIATWNVNSLKVRLAHVLDWLAQAQPDLLALQEIKCTDDNFPAAEFERAGYHAAWSGQKTYNGVAVISRNTLSDPVTDVPGLDDPQRRILAVTCANVRFINLYVVNGQAVGSDKFAYKLDWLAHVSRYVRAEVERHAHVVVAGDFNIAPQDRDVHDPDAWREQILCSSEERSALAHMCDAGLSDVFRCFDQAPDTFSWWDYRAGAFRRNTGLRIDLILATAALTQRCTACAVDTGPRKLERPSDHAPVYAEFMDLA